MSVQILRGLEKSEGLFNLKVLNLHDCTESVSYDVLSIRVFQFCDL